MARVRAGDDRAFEIVFDRYHRGLLAFCTHMLGSREEAEDALQHTFMAAYRSMRRTSGAIRLKAWLYTIARNRCLSMLRARREQVAFDETRAATDGLAADVDRRAQLRGLLADLERLPDDQRAALVLFELGDHAHDEIAEILGVRREKVKALVFQARESLASWRRARETPCTEIREQLATLRGAALKRAILRRHVARCESCRDFETEVRRQRRALAAALPIAPTAGLKATVLTSVLGGGGAAAAGGGAAVTGLGAAKGIAAKTMLCAAIAGSAGSAGYVAVRDIDSRLHTPPMQAQTEHEQHKAHHERAAAAKPAAAQVAAAPATATIAAAPAKAAVTKPSSAGADDRAHHHGRAFAFGRGGERGRHRGFGRSEHEWSRGERDRGGLRALGERGRSGERARGGERQARGEQGGGGEQPAVGEQGGGAEQRAVGDQQASGKQLGAGKQGGRGNGGGWRRGQDRGGGSRHAGVSPR